MNSTSRKIPQVVGVFLLWLLCSNRLPCCYSFSSPKAVNSKIQIHEQFISSFHREGSSSSSSWYSTSNQRDNDLTGAKSTCIGNRFLKNKARFESFRRYSSSLNGVEGGTSFQPTIPIARNEDDDEIQESDIVICGGGPAGLLAAIMLSQKLKKRNVKPTKKMITVIDRLPEPAKSDDDSIWNDIAKFYLIGLGGRGQLALNEFGVWEDVKRRCVPVLGRKDWSPGDPNPVERIFGSSKRITTQVLPRDKLVSVLYEHIQERYSDYVTFYYGYEVQPNIDFYYKNSNSVLLQVAKCTNPTTEAEYKSLLLLDPSATQDDKRQECDIDSAMLMSTKLLIGTDGTVRSIANAMEEEDKKKYSTMNVLQKLRAGRPFRVTRYIDNNKRIYKSIPFKVPKDWRGDLNYSARTKSGINFDALPANVNGDYCGILLIKDGAEDEMTSRNSSPTNFRERLEEALPQFSQLIDDDTIRTVATKPSSQLPSFRYVSPRLHQGNNCVILGDCIHTVKPYFGLGANSALEDVKVLSECLDYAGFRLDDSDGTTAAAGVTRTTSTISKAIREFTEKRAKDAKTLVRLSRELDRPGTLGFITFILPIILDSIFSSMAPSIFNPNTITMLQREDLTFGEVARMKRKDRALQVTILVSSMVGVAWCSNFLLRKVAKLTGLSPLVVGLATMIATGSISRLSKLIRKPSAPDETPKSVEVTSSQQTFIKPAFGKK